MVPLTDTSEFVDDSVLDIVSIIPDFFEEECNGDTLEMAMNSSVSSLSLSSIVASVVSVFDVNTVVSSVKSVPV